MPDIRIILFSLWVALMLTYFLGDVLRIFAGDFAPGEIGGVQASQTVFIGAGRFLRPAGASCI